LLPDGRVMFFSYYSESLRPHIWNPATNTFSSTAVAPYELFCAGHTLMADGRVFIAGGHVADYVGFNRAVIYDAEANTFTSVPNMNKGRWYPTTTVLPNGDILVVSGDVNGSTNANSLPQVFQMSSKTWRSLTSAQLVLPLYPLMFVAPNGEVFYAGNSSTSRYLNTSGTGSWTKVASTNFSSRDYGPGVMYDVGKLLIVGGDDPPTATAEIIDLTAAAPAWKFTGSMHYKRRQHNAVVMPDGKVLIVGGSKGSGFDDASAPVYPSEIWDPATGTFTIVASISKYRGYHSTALLLPDGRILSAGGNVGGANAQVFSPPYLFAGARPAVSSAPGDAVYGQTVFIGTEDAGDISRVTLVRTGSVTHTFDENQRFMGLGFTKTASGLNVTMPANANLAPPGYYMLFMLNIQGVPSVGKIVKLAQN
jgi:Galactose oxidase-like, Early set domain